MTLREILEGVFYRGFRHGLSDGLSSDSEKATVEWAKKDITAHIISLLPKEDELNNIICDLDKANEGNGAPCTEISKAILASIKERIEKEMGNDQA